MQSPNEQPAEETRQSAGEAKGSDEQASQPIYEFPADNSLLDQTASPASETHVLPEPETPPRRDDEAINKGLIYPPPPSFYQNMQVPAQRLPLPAPPDNLLQKSSYRNAQHGQLYAKGVQAPPFPLAPAYVVPPPVKSSSKWIWILVAVVGSAFLISCGLCSWAFYSVLQLTDQQTTGAMNAVNSYYNAIQRREYSAAYSDLAPASQIKGLSQSDFIAKAQQQEEHYGSVLSYTPQQPSVASDPNSGLDLSYLTIQVNVVRTRLNYTVSLTLHRVNGNWKITNFNEI